MIDFETATMVYKSLHGLAPPYMQDMFHKLSHSRKRVLRSTETDLQGRTFKFCHIISYHQLFKHGSPLNKAVLQGAMHLKYYKSKKFEKKTKYNKSR